MRLFVALQLSDEIKNCLMQTIQKIKPYQSAGHFVKKENLHLTLAFIGETPHISRAKQAVMQLRQEPFLLELNQLGTFHRSTGDILWAGIQPNSSLQSLAQQIQQNLKEQGFVLQSTPFFPHLTLGREVIFNQGFSLEEFSKEEFSSYAKKRSMPIEKVSLMKSERVNGKLKYTEIAFVGLNNIMASK